MRSKTQEIEAAATALGPWLDAPADRSLGSDVDGELTSLAGLRHAESVLTLRALAAHQAEDLAMRDGFRTTAHWWAHRSGCSQAAAKGEVELAVRLYGSDLGATGEALGARRISVGQARAIDTATRRLLPEQVATLEAILLASPSLAPETMIGLGREVQQRLECDEDKQARWERQQLQRSLTISDCGDMVLVTALLTPEVGARFFRLLQTLSAPRPLDAKHPDRRAAAQRRHDALGEIVEVAARVHAGEHVDTRSDTLVNVVVTPADLSRLADPGRRGHRPPDLRLRPHLDARQRRRCGAAGRGRRP